MNFAQRIIIPSAPQEEICNYIFIGWISKKFVSDSYPGLHAFARNLFLILKVGMRAIRLAITFIVCSLVAVAQKKLPVEEWVNRLKDESSKQVTKHYAVYYDISKIDSVSKIRAAMQEL